MSITYNTIPPPNHLAPYVRFFWILESDAPYTHRQMADISPELIFHYKGRFDELAPNGNRTPSFRSGIHGQSSSISRFTIDKGFGIFGVYFYPFALPILFNIKASELTNQMLDLKTLWGGEGDILEEKMMLAANNRERMQIITDFLSDKLRSISNDPRAVFSSVKYIMEAKGRVKIEKLAARYSLSKRQFSRNFKQVAGFNPKLFSRIIRFHTAIKRYGTQPQSLTEIALDCGYYDQSHFIQDFREFAGCLPSAFFSGEAEGIEWRNG